MTDLKTIFFWWYNFRPTLMPEGLTHLQKEEWKKNNAEITVKNVAPPFIGQKIKFSACVKEIYQDKIVAYTNCVQKGASRNPAAPSYVDNSYGWGENVEWILSIWYSINYDNNVLTHDEAKSILKNSAIEFEGEILKCRWHDGTDEYEGARFSLSLDIKLTQIKRDNVRVENPLAPFQTDRKCFIATAAFGNRNAVEVILLRDLEMKHYQQHYLVELS